MRRKCGAQTPGAADDNIEGRALIAKEYHMQFKKKTLPLAVVGALSVLALQPALAQDTAASQPQIQKVVVTGSLISRADKETPAPVQVLTADDLAKTGYTSVAEVLSTLSANGQGTLGTGFAGAFANGASGVSLRGLTVGLTLVLIDGHRMAPYPLSDDAQRQFVDVSSIPFDAIERIEVLKDGASDIYGSDAVAGVVNVILKKSFKGTSIKADMGNSQHGGGKNKKLAITSGFGDLNDDGYNAFVSAEFRHADPIKVYQRDNQFWASGDWRGFGGVSQQRGVPSALNSFLTAASSPFFYNASGTGGVKNPANFQFLDPNCNYDKYMAGGCMVRDTVSNLQPESQNVNLLAGFTKKLGDDWTLALKASQFRRTSINNRGLPAVYSPSSFAGSTSLVPGQNPAIVNVWGSTVFPASNPYNKLGAPARLYGQIPDVGPANTQDNTSTASRFAVDLTGSLMGWDVGASAGMSKVEVKDRYSGYINRYALYTALNRATNPFNPMGGNSPADMNVVAPRFTNQTESKLSYAEVHGSRELAQLPGGPLSLATGLSWTHKDLNSPPASLLSQGVVGNGSAYAFGKETDTAAFAELAGSPVKNLETSISARYDHYDTYGNSFTPGAKFKWAATPMLSVRGTFAKGFRAPNAAEVGTAGSFFVFQGINDPILCKDGNPKTAGNVPSACGFTPSFVQITTKDLQPETSKSYTLGAILEPTRDLNASLDYYKIDVRNQINTASGLPGFVPSYVRNQPFPVDIADGKGGTAPGTPSVGTIAYATSGYVNAGKTLTTGAELDLRARHKFGDLGTLRGELNLTHMISYQITNAGTTIELAGTHGPGVISGNTGNPKNRANLTLGWDKGPMALTATVNWVDSFSALDPAQGARGLDCSNVAINVGNRNYFFGSTTPSQFCRIPSFATTDLNLTYKLSDNLTLRGSILNLFDKAPPIDVATYGNSGALTAYNASLHQAGAVGRFFTVGVNYQF
jgi:iron complex outermembrane receptor protein